MVAVDFLVSKHHKGKGYFDKLEEQKIQSTDAAEKGDLVVEVN